MTSRITGLDWLFGWVLWTLLVGVALGLRWRRGNDLTALR